MISRYAPFTASRWRVVQVESAASIQKLRAAATKGRSGIPALVAVLAKYPMDPGVVALAAQLLVKIAKADRSSLTLSAIATSRALPHLAASLDAGLGTSPPQRGVFVSVSVSLGELLATDERATGFAHTVAEAGLLESLSAGLAAHLYHLDATKAVLMTLLYVFVGGEGDAIHKSGALPQVVAALSRHTPDSLTVSAACGIIAGILEEKGAGGKRVNICTALQAGAAISPLRAALSLHVEDVYLVPQITNAITLLAHHSAFGTPALDELAASVGPLTVALSRYVDDPHVAGSIGKSFKSLMQHQSIALAVASNPNATAALVVALKTILIRPPGRRSADPRKPTIGNIDRGNAVALLGGALTNLAANDAGSTGLAAAGAIPVLTAALAAYGHDPDTAAELCAAFNNLALRANLLRRIIRSGAVPPLVAALAAGVHNADTVVAVSHTLTYLSDIPEGLASAVKAGVLTLLDKAVTLHGPASQAGSAASTCLLEMLSHRND